MSQSLYPLKPLSVAMLSALAAGEAHAYMVQRQMTKDVIGAFEINSRAVYRELPRLTSAGPVAIVPDTYPVRYRLTQHGRRILMGTRAHALQTFKLLQERL